MPMLMRLARVTTRRSEVWRHCEICDELAAMAPYATTCDACAEVVHLVGRTERRRGCA
jgi:hypothetical protein